jgi:hypothetical protein
MNAKAAKVAKLSTTRERCRSIGAATAAPFATLAALAFNRFRLRFSEQDTKDTKGNS